MKTLGQRLLDETRKNGSTKLTARYWGSKLIYDGKYFIQDYCPKFNGMREVNRKPIAATLISACDSLEELTELLQPVADFSEGDPSNYAPHISRSVPLVIEVA